MTRTLAVAALLALPAVAPAQVGARRPSGPAVLGGAPVSGPPIVSGGTAIFPVRTPVPPRFGVGGGSLGEQPPAWLPSGGWGNVAYPWPVVVAPAPSAPQPAPARASGVRAGAADPQPAAAARTEATLVIEFPAAAEVRVNGKKLDRDPAAEWTLRSPPLTAGEAHTFEVRGRWTAGGKTYEATRSVTVLAGERSRSLVVSGTEVRD